MHQHSLATFLTGTVLAFSLSGCASGIGSTESHIGIPTSTPSTEAATTSTTAEVAAEIAGTRPELQKSLDTYSDGRCSRVLESKERGIEGVTCVASKIAIENYGKALVMRLEMHEPWAEEIEALADETRTRAKSMSAAAGMTSDGAGTMLDMEALFMTTTLNKWDAYLR